MAKITPNEVLNKAITLIDGGQIAVPHATFEEAERFRTQLYKSRKVMEKRNRILADQLYISREKSDRGWLVIIAREMAVNDVVIIENGVARPFEREESVISSSEEAERERIVRLMKEDGMTDEEIDDALHQQAEDGFDKAASKVEAMQGITKE